MAGQAAATRGIAAFSARPRDVAAAEDRAEGRAWRHVIGSGRLGAESSRTWRATREGVRVWPRLWRGVERGHSNHETHENAHVEITVTVACCGACISLLLMLNGLICL